MISKCIDQFLILKITLILLSNLLLQSTVKSQSYGVIVGANYSSQVFSNPIDPGYGKLQSNFYSGFNGGAWYKLKLKDRFGIRADLYFQRIGFTFPTQIGSMQS